MHLVPIRRTVSVLVVALILSIAVGAPSATGGEPPAAVSVRCLDQRLRPVSRCPTVELDVRLAIRGDQLEVTVANTGSTSWAGGPVAAEVPVALDPVPADSTSWAVRAGVVVARCAFEPVEQIRSRGAVSCRIPRAGLTDGPHTLWLTGFVGGIPAVGGAVRADPPVVGVVPIAESRSVRFRITGDRVRVDEGSGAGAESVGASTSPAEGAGVSVAAIVASVSVALAVVGWLLLRRRRRSGADDGGSQPR